MRLRASALVGFICALATGSLYVACSSFEADETKADADAAIDTGSDTATAPSDGGATDFTKNDNWQVFNVASVAASANGFFGGVYDGRHLYLVPGKGSAARLDTAKPFNDGNSWETFDTRSLSKGGMLGGAFDGRWVYFAPNGLNAPGNTNALRYDTKAPFTAGGSWESFSTATLFDAGSGGAGGTYFDGKTVSLMGASVKVSPEAGPDAGLAQGGFTRAVYAQFDVNGSFEDAGSWTATEGTSLTPAVPISAYAGVAFDGKYAYQPSSSNATFARISLPDTIETFDTASFTGDKFIFFGAVMDDAGYVYLPPVWRYGNTGINGVSGTVVRYDTKKPFKEVGSYQKFDVSSINRKAQAFAGGVFDGRFIYLAPGLNTGIVVRYDTTRPFGDGSAWSSFDLNAIKTATAFVGMVFDGQYVYLVPREDGFVVRFRAREDRLEPKALPSFF